MIFCGARDGDGISDFYKAFIKQEKVAGAGSVVITAYVGSEDMQISLNQIWDSPFEGDTVGAMDKVSKGAALGQAATGTTSKTVFNSKLVWQGADALEFSLPLQFIAYADAKKEVHDPVRYLMQMSSPELNDELPFGSVPQKVVLDIGRRLITPVYITNVSYSEEAPKTVDGYMTHCKVTITCKLDGSINASAVPELFK